MTIIIIYCLYGLMFFALSYSPEYIVYKQNEKKIARVSFIGLLETKVDFYEPVNIFL